MNIPEKLRFSCEKNNETIIFLFFFCSFTAKYLTFYAYGKKERDIKWGDVYGNPLIFAHIFRAVRPAFVLIKLNLVSFTRS